MKPIDLPSTSDISKALHNGGVVVYENIHGFEQIECGSIICGYCFFCTFNIDENKVNKIINSKNTGFVLDYLMKLRSKQKKNKTDKRNISACQRYLDIHGVSYKNNSYLRMFYKG